VYAGIPSISVSQVQVQHRGWAPLEVYGLIVRSQERNAMASLANLDDEEILALALGSLHLSSDDSDEQIAQLPPEGSASANHISRPRTPTSNGKDDLAPVSRSPTLA
jgi:hypothetical protein